MKSRVKLIIIALLGMLSVFSVGFATWIVTQPLDSYTGSINTLVYEPHDNAKYIKIVGSEVFDYYNTGFVENDTVITHDGKITATFEFNVKDYITDFGNTGLTIELLLKHSSDSRDLNVFVDGAPFTISSTVSDGLGGTSSSSTDAQGCLTTITLDTLPAGDSVAFTVTYDLHFTGTHEEFKSQVFEFLKNVRFAVEAKITSK